MIHHSRTVLFVRLPSQPTSSCFSATVLFVGCSIGSPIAHTEGPRATPSECIVQLFVRSFDLTNHCLCCSHFFAYTHHSMLQHLLFRCLSPLLFGSQMEEQQNVPLDSWWNHSGYNLVRVPRRLHSPCHSHRSRTAQRHQVPPNSQPSLSSIISHFPVGLTRDVRTQTVSLCTVPSTHHATKADASTQLSISECLQLCHTKHPFRRTVPLRLHEDPREAQTASNTGNEMAATFADAATQLSFC